MQYSNSPILQYSNYDDYDILNPKEYRYYSATFLTAEIAEVAEHSFFFFSLKVFSLRSPRTLR